jgi:hypothetical protein
MASRLRWLLLVTLAGLTALLCLSAVASGSTGTGVVHGTIRDNAVVQKTVRNATVSVAGLPAAVDGNTYSLTGVPSGMQTMIVAAPRHAKLTQMVLVLEGDNLIDVRLDLTPAETYRRYYQAYNHFHYRLAYKMLHPDERAQVPYKDYYEEMYFFTHPPFLSMRILKVVMVPTWRARWLHKTYRDVAVITTRRTYRLPGVDQLLVDRGDGHWIQIDGRWYRISSRRP